MGVAAGRRDAEQSPLLGGKKGKNPTTEEKRAPKEPGDRWRRDRWVVIAGRAGTELLSATSRVSCLAPEPTKMSRSTCPWIRRTTTQRTATQPIHPAHPPDREEKKAATDRRPQAARLVERRSHSFEVPQSSCVRQEDINYLALIQLACGLSGIASSTAGSCEANVVVTEHYTFDSYLVLQKRPCFCSPAARPDICPDLRGETAQHRAKPCPLIYGSRARRKGDDHQECEPRRH